MKGNFSICSMRTNDTCMILMRRMTISVFFILFLVFPNAASDSRNTGLTGASRTDTVVKAIPYTLPWDDMPIDLSFLYEKEKPAGKHGFLKVEGDRFVFEDGTGAKFWGTNFNSGANFPTHEYSEKVAKRLAKTGVNMVRFHQLDAEWSTPNIFQFTKGENKTNTLNLDPASMDRLDYLIHCLKQQGIYIYMDLLTYRRFRSGDGIEAADKLADAAKPYSTFNRRLIELQKKFNYDLWTHINPYTKLAYKDDPAIVLVEVTNENDLFTQKVILEPYRSELEVLYREWAAAGKIKVSKERVEFNQTDENLRNFYVEITRRYYTEMIQHMRETGVKIPIAGTNWSRGGAHLSAQLAGDFTDSHAYWYAWQWEADHKKFMNESMTGSMDNMLPPLAFNRVAGKPFFVSEWDNPWPNEWRAESALLLAAAGAFQGWGGFCIHTYRYSTDEKTDMIGKPITSDAIGGVYYRGGVFDTFNDPAKFGLFYHAALLFRREDIAPADNTVYIGLNKLAIGPDIKALQLSVENQRIEMVLPGGTHKEGMLVDPGEYLVDVFTGEVTSDTKEFYRNLKTKTGWIDTPRTKAAYGFLGKEGKLDLSDLNICVKTDFATVAISSLTSDPVNRSLNMLLTAVGRADNTNCRYNEDHTVQLEVGNGPILVEVVEAEFEIKTSKSKLKVLAINPQGFTIGQVPAEYVDGIFKFEIGKKYPSMYYLIQEY
jgi:hypothetical protein